MPLQFSQVLRLITAIIFMTSPLVARAQYEPSVRHVEITINKSRIVSFAGAFKTASSASTAITEVTPLTDHSLYIVGKNIGTTSISIFNENMQLVEYLDVEVRIDTVNLEGKIKELTGINSIQVSSINGKVILSGTVPDGVSADHVVSIAKAMSNEVINLMTIVPTGQRSGKS